MAARQSFSREPSVAAQSTRSRRSSIASNPNVFSDDYALDSPVSHDGFPPTTPSPPAESSSSSSFEPPHPRESIIVAPYPQIPISRSGVGSSLKRALPGDDASSTAGSAMDRSLSVSTRFSIPRPQSPYTGPTAPSHPYAMYPQVTRASSIASESTIRPLQETPFVPRGGPEHPYAMYTQNTVPEDEEDITAAGIPIGFPRSTEFGISLGGSSSDVGDIVGSDGHVEQLPPYTRYADNTVAKGNMDQFHGPETTSLRLSTSRETLQATDSSPTSASTLNHPRETFDVEGTHARKEGWKHKAQRRMCGGMPLWGVIVLIVVVILAALLGGVVGGVVGNHQGTAKALADATPTTTVYLDALPTTTGPNTPSLPTGRYTVPLHANATVDSCIANRDKYAAAWDCLDYAYIGISVNRSSDASQPMQVTFDDYSVNTQNFRYGPQPPDFNGSSFPLSPHVDRNDESEDKYGVAMFFSVAFDKLIIVPEYAIPPEQYNSKRAVPKHVIERGRGWRTQPLKPEDKPWFCFWNSTINEFWIYLNHNNTASTTTSPSSVTATPTASDSQTMIPWSQSAPVQMQAANLYPGAVTTTFAANFPTFTVPSHAHHHAYVPATPTVGKRADSYVSRNSSDPSAYPNLIKMVEKRKPQGNIQPYCQQMQVLDDFRIVPLEEVEKVCIKEVEYAGPIPGSNKVRKDEFFQQELKSDCICQWMSDLHGVS